MTRESLGCLAIIAVLLAGIGLSGCAGVVAGGAATAGVAIAQERSVGNAIDDAGIKILINSLMFEKSEKLFLGVRTRVVEGRVLLTGKVTDPDDRVEATKIAWQSNGVKEVLNEIQITNQSGINDYFKDKRITLELRFKMITDRKISDINYTIDTVNGAVFLMGIAQDEAELGRVTHHARNISGVTKVVSHVRLKDDPRRS